jgi:hypothetical protein
MLMKFCLQSYHQNQTDSFLLFAPLAFISLILSFLRRIPNEIQHPDCLHRTERSSLSGGPLMNSSTESISQEVVIYFNSSDSLRVFCEGWLNKEEGWADVSIRIPGQPSDIHCLLDPRVPAYIESFLLGQNPLPLSIN